MELLPHIADLLASADSKAFATNGPHGINVVPVSTIRIIDGKIWLMNYFFKKTVENIMHDPHISLVAWKGFSGYQIKGTVEYLTEGQIFEDANLWVEQNLKDRVLKGLLIISPESVYDISPTTN